MTKNRKRPALPAFGRSVVAGTMVAGVLAAGGAALVVAPATASAAPTPAGCTSVTLNGTTFTAGYSVTSGSGSSIPSTINATGCDVGIYVGSTSSAVTINGVTVTGANDHGILAVDNTSGLTIENSTIDGNGVSPSPGIAENKAIELVGVTGATVSGNQVYDNTADGGIGIADLGPLNPGLPGYNKNVVPVASSNDVVTGNTVYSNYGGCGIVVAAYNPGAGIGSGVKVTDNTVTGAAGKFGPHGPVIGGIVVAADAPGTMVTGVTVGTNTVSQSGIPGIVVHSNAPGDNVSGVTLTGNKLSGNDWLSSDGPPKPAGIIIAASQIPGPAAPALTGTTATGNTIDGEFYGIWHAGDASSTLSPNTITTMAGGTAVYQVPAPGSGYWMAGADGSAYNFGTAGSYGSLAGKTLAAPIVGLSPTSDQGGYLMAGADGGVFTFGDANYFGSLGGVKLAAPVVGIASTPYEQASPPATPNPAGKGYWMVAKDGGVFSFGDATFYGSEGGHKLNAPIVGMAPTPDGHGYWLVGSDGGVFAFGDANFYGSLGDKKLNAPVVGIVPTTDGGGYWMVAKDGGVFAFGDANFYGSAGSLKLAAPVVGMVAMPGGAGYWLMAGDGGVFSYGHVAFFGSEGGKTLPKPVVGAGGVGPTVAA